MYDPYMACEVRITANVAKVLRALLSDPTGEHYGYSLMRASALPSGNLYPILGRLEAAGWIEGHQEDIDPAVAGRRPRRYYCLTTEGAMQAPTALAELRAAITEQPVAKVAPPKVRPA
jgi:PadR family transcriptional regulator PadR